MTLEQILGNPQLAADFAHFIFVERAERLDDALGGEQLLDAGHAVVMRLDDGSFFRAAGFDGVGIDRALPQNPVAIQQVPRFDDAFLHAHELFADDLALLLPDRGPRPAA